MEKQIINYNHFQLNKIEIEMIASYIQRILADNESTLSFLKDNQDIYKKLPKNYNITIFDKDKIPKKNKYKNVFFNNELSFINHIEENETNNYIFFNPFELKDKYISKSDWVKVYIEDISLEKILNNLSKKTNLKGIGLLLPKNYNIGSFLCYLQPTNINIIKLSKFYFININL